MHRLPLLGFVLVLACRPHATDLDPIEPDGREPTKPSDPAKAEPRCDLASPDVCIDYGLRESVEVAGTVQDFTRARDHFAVACEAGASAGCRHVALLYREGKLGDSPGTPDMTAALEWFQLACTAAMSWTDAGSCIDASTLLAEDPTKLADAQALAARACGFETGGACEVAEQLAARIANAAAKIPGSNLLVGGGKVNGFAFRSLECRIEGEPEGLFRNRWADLDALQQSGNHPKLFTVVAHVAALASKHEAIDQCGESGALVEVRWTSDKAKIRTAEGVGPEGACVAKLLKRVRVEIPGREVATNGECVATFVLGSSAV